MFVLYDPDTMYIYSKRASKRGAAISMAALKKNKKNVVIGSEEEYNKYNILVPVVSIGSGKTVMIPRSDVGTCCDPSMDIYWSM